jgi:hypothetical protein
VSVRGIGWYSAAFIALIISATFIGVAAASFLASLTPLYVSIACSVAAMAFGVVAAVRARPADASLQYESEPTPVDDDPTDVDEPTDAVAPADAAHPGDGE